MIEDIRIPEGWILRYNKLPKEDITEENKDLFVENLFEVVSPQGILLHVNWKPTRDLDGRFHLEIKKTDDLDEYHGVQRSWHTSAVYGDIELLIKYFSSPDWRENLEIYAERKYTVVGDRVFYRDEEDDQVLVCMDKESREEIFRKNLAEDRIARIEKHPEGKGLFILFDGRKFTEEDYERMNRTNFGLFGLDGNVTWWAEPFIIRLYGGEVCVNYVYRQVGRWLPKGVSSEDKYDPIVSSMKYRSWCKFDLETGKLKEYGQGR